MFLKLGSSETQGSAKGCQVFRGTKTRNDGKVLLAVLNLYVRIEIRVATFDTNHSATASMQTINRCFNPEASRTTVNSVRTAGHRQRQCVRRNDQVIDNVEVSR
jgi:hypothetical protein